MTRGRGQAAPGPATAPGPPHPVALDLVEAQANFTYRVGVRVCFFTEATYIKYNVVLKSLLFLIIWRILAYII